jgi:nicotinate-nucleotide adenylyltransferase
VLKAEYNVETIDAPIVEISSTFIRKSINKGKSAGFFMPQKSFIYLQKNKLYQ